MNLNKKDIGEEVFDYCKEELFKLDHEKYSCVLIVYNRKTGERADFFSGASDQLLGSIELLKDSILRTRHYTINGGNR